MEWNIAMMNWMLIEHNNNNLHIINLMLLHIRYVITIVQFTVSTPRQKAEGVLWRSPCLCLSTFTLFTLQVAIQIGSSPNLV